MFTNAKLTVAPDVPVKSVCFAISQDYLHRQLQNEVFEYAGCADWTNPQAGTLEPSALSEVFSSLCAVTSDK
jgi:hypothetical protein